MLTAALDGLVDRFGLEGERLGEVAAGAVLKHSRDFNLTRECVLGSRLAPRRPPTTSSRPAGPAWRRRSSSPTRSPSARSTPAIAGGVDTTSDAPIALNERPARDPARRQPPRSRRRPRGSARRACARSTSCPRSRATRSRAPACRWASTRRITAARMGDRPRGAGRARRSQPPQPRRRLRARLPRRPRHALPRARARPEPAPRLDRREAREAQAGLRRRRGRR